LRIREAIIGGQPFSQQAEEEEEEEAAAAAAIQDKEQGKSEVLYSTGTMQTSSRCKRRC
jgi:hypothetical protein